MIKYMNKEREKENNSVSKPRINHMYASVLLRCSLCAIVCLAVSSNAYALSCSTDIANTIGDNTGTISHTNDAFTVDYGDKGLLTGVGQCSDSSDEIVDDLSGTVGNNCYCKLENYIPNGGTIQTLSGKYVFIYGFPNLPNNVACTSNCAERCAGMLATTDWPDFRDALLCESLESPTSVVCPPEFPSYDADATAETDCYRSCVNSDIEHATAISGNVYYNGTDDDGTKKCTPISCENGWTKKDEGVDLMTLIGVDEEFVGQIGNSSTGSAAAYIGTMTPSNAGISDIPLAFVIDYGNKGKITGRGRCSTRSVANPWYEQNGYTFESDHFVDVLPDETGQTGAQYCYCQLDGYIPDGDTVKNLLSPWVFVEHFGEFASVCENDCALRCIRYWYNNKAKTRALRAALFGAVNVTPAMCKANTITINWSDTEYNDVIANDAGTVEYGGDVRTPVKAQIKKGKAFNGWKFSSTSGSGN